MRLLHSVSRPHDLCTSGTDRNLSFPPDWHIEHRPSKASLLIYCQLVCDLSTPSVLLDPAHAMPDHGHGGHSSSFQILREKSMHPCMPLRASRHARRMTGEITRYSGDPWDAQPRLSSHHSPPTEGSPPSMITNCSSETMPSEGTGLPADFQYSEISLP